MAKIRFPSLAKTLILNVLALLPLLLTINSTTGSQQRPESRQNPHRKNDKHEANQMNKDTKEMIPILISHMHWNTKEKVLDYGCGDGAVGYHLILPKVKESLGHQYGLDIMYNNMERTKRVYKSPFITYASGNLLGNTTDQFPYLDVKFDKIFAIYVFHYVRDILKLVERFWYLLNPNGYVGFTSLTEQAIVFQVTLRVSKLPAWKDYLANYETTFHPSWSRSFEMQTGKERRKTVNTMFKMAGFRTKFLGFGNVTSFHKNVDSLIEPWFWESQIYDTVPENLVPDLKMELKKQFSQVTKLPEDATNFKLTQTYLMSVLEKEEI